MLSISVYNFIYINVRGINQSINQRHIYLFASYNEKYYVEDKRQTERGKEKRKNLE